MADDAASTAIASSSVTEEELTLTVKWSGKEYTIRVCGDGSVAELKRRICQLTNVLPKRQKLLHPKIGSKLSDDSFLLSQLPLMSSLKMTMIGYSSLSVIKLFFYNYQVWFFTIGFLILLENLGTQVSFVKFGRTFLKI